MTSLPLGIIAGEGSLPVRIIEACVAAKRPYYVLAFEGQTPPALVDGHPHDWCKLGSLGASFACLRRAGVQELVMAGAFHRPSWTDIRPDFAMAQWLARHGRKILGDDGLLRVVIEDLEAEGFHVVSPESIVGELLLAPKGVLTTCVPDAHALLDIDRGMKIVGALGVLDIGQAAVVQQGLVLGVEAIEGTKNLLKRAGELRREGPGGVLVKRTKPGQEGRVDRPVVGLGTIREAYAAGLAGIAVEAGSVIMLDRDEMIVFADDHGLYLVGVDVHDA